MKHITVYKHIGQGLPDHGPGRLTGQAEHPGQVDLAGGNDLKEKEPHIDPDQDLDRLGKQLWPKGNIPVF